MNTDNKPTTKAVPSSPLPARATGHESRATVSTRFSAIADYFLAEQKAIYKTSRTALYKKERELIEIWARDTDVPLEVIRKGIHQGFREALDRKAFVSSLLYCGPHVALAIRAWEESIQGSLLAYERRKAGK